MSVLSGASELGGKVTNSLCIDGCRTRFRARAGKSPLHVHVHVYVLIHSPRRFSFNAFFSSIVCFSTKKQLSVSINIHQSSNLRFSLQAWIEESGIRNQSYGHLPQFSVFPRRRAVAITTLLFHCCCCCCCCFCCRRHYVRLPCVMANVKLP